MEEKLLEYNGLIAEIKRLEYEIIKLQNEEIQPNSPILDPTGVRPKGFVESSVEKRVVSRNDRINELQKQIQEKKAEKEYIEAKLALLKPIERKTIELKYFKNLNDEDIMQEIQRYSTSTVYRLIERALKKMQ